MIPREVHPGSVAPESEVVMNEYEIVKALKLCFAPDGMACSKCPYHKFGKLCKVERSKDALNLINQLKAENSELLRKNTELQYEKVKLINEAIKEFAERLKEKAYLDGAVSITQELVVDVRDIDDLVEEMTEDEEK